MAWNRNNKSKRKKPDRNRKTPPEGLACFWKLVKDVSERGPIHFVMEDRDDNRTDIEIRNGVFRMDGEELNETAVLSYISRNASDFERLFMAAAKKYNTDGRLMGNLYIAKLADTSFLEKLPAVIRINDGNAVRTLSITRAGQSPRFEIDGKVVSENSGREFIWRNYSSFITGFKSAMKNMTRNVEEEQPKKKKRVMAGPSSTVTEDGRLLVDIFGYLGEEEKKTKREFESQVAADILKKKNKGYVSD